MSDNEGPKGPGKNHLAGGENFRNMQCNYSAMMYVITEQQALIGTLLGELLDSGIINEAQLSKITGVYGNAEILTPCYSDLYKRFADYFIRVHEALDEEDGPQPDGWVPGERIDDDGKKD